MQLVTLRYACCANQSLQSATYHKKLISLVSTELETDAPAWQMTLQIL